MSSSVDTVAMLVRWTLGEPDADARREDVMALLNEVVHLQAGRDEDTAQLGALADEVARLRAELQQVRTERDDACVELVRERGDTVALLWACASAANATSRTVAMNMASVATRIERGEHRREEGA